MGKYRKSTVMPDDHGQFHWFPKMLATSFGAGFLPVAPGTWGALVAIVLWLPLYLWSSPAVTLAVTAAAVVIYGIAGTWASNVSERYWGEDPVVACADETVGQWLALLPVVGCGICPWWEILLAFALFHLFDIFKPLGIRAMERIPGGAGMMADDVLAGIYSAAIILLINLKFYYV